MEVNDAFFGERRYEAADPEGNRWHFGKPLASVRRRRGEPNTRRLTTDRPVLCSAHRGTPSFWAASLPLPVLGRHLCQLLSGMAAQHAERGPPGCRRSSGEQPGAEEVEHLVEGGARRLAGFVDQVLGEDRVRLHRAVGVGVVVVELDGDERVAELLAEVLEALGRARAVAREAEAEDLEARRRRSGRLTIVEVGGRACRSSACWALVTADGQRRLRQHRCEHAASVAIARAKPPVKHMPTAPTPGPPHRSCSCGGEGAEPVDHRRCLARSPTP